MSHVAADGSVTPGFARLMVTLAEAYPSVRLREGTVRSYAMLLSDLTVEQVGAAMCRATQESEFFPSVALIRRMVLGSTDDAATVAWTALDRAARAFGAYQTVEIEDGAAAAALVAVFGSWPTFCATDEGPELALKRQAFMAAYRKARRGHDAHLRQARLVGLCDRDGVARGVGGRIALNGDLLVVLPRQLKGGAETRLLTGEDDERIE